MHDSGLDMDEFLCESVACRAVWMAMVESLRCMKHLRGESMVTRAGSRGEAPLAFTNSQLESLCFSSHGDGVLTVSAMTKMMTNLILIQPLLLR